MSVAPASSHIAVSVNGRSATGGGPWLLEVRASKNGLIFWMIVVGAVAAPFITAMAGVYLFLFYWVLVSPQPAAFPRALIAIVTGLGVPAVVAAPVVFIRMVIGMWRCLRNGRPAVRADAEGLETYHLYNGWERLPWEEVGTIALPRSFMLVIEHRDPKTWLARQTLWRRWVVRNSRKHTQIDAALGFGLPMEEDGEVVMYKIATIRDATHMGMKVEAGAESEKRKTKSQSEDGAEDASR